MPWQFELGARAYPNAKLIVGDFVSSVVLADLPHKFALVTAINVLHCLTGDRERSLLLSHLAAAAMPQAALIITTMIGPIDVDLIEQRLPRAYKLPQQIIDEVAANGWEDVAVLEQTAPTILPEYPISCYSHGGNERPYARTRCNVSGVPRCWPSRANG